MRQNCPVYLLKRVVRNCEVDIEYYRASVTRSCEYPLRGLERGTDNDMQIFQQAHEGIRIRQCRLEAFYTFYATYLIIRLTRSIPIHFLDLSLFSFTIFFSEYRIYIN